jgi:hypothetical protein
MFSFISLVCVFNPIFYGQVICDLAFLNAYSSKISEAKNAEKSVILNKCFLYIFCLRTSPNNDAVLTYSVKSTKNPKIQVI